MKYILITFKMSEQKSMELKVPANASAGELLHMLSQAMDIEVTKERRLQAEPIGRILDNEKLLEEEGVSNGALLTLI